MYPRHERGFYMFYRNQTDTRTQILPDYGVIDLGAKYSFSIKKEKKESGSFALIASLNSLFFLVGVDHVVLPPDEDGRVAHMFLHEMNNTKFEYEPTILLPSGDVPASRVVLPMLFDKKEEAEQLIQVFSKEGKDLLDSSRGTKIIPLRMPKGGGGFIFPSVTKKIPMGGFLRELYERFPYYKKVA